MHRGEDEMPGLCRAQRQPHRLRIAHFADHQHVRVFAQGVEQRLLETRRVAPDFALPDERAPGRNEYSIGLSTVMMCCVSVKLIS